MRQEAVVEDGAEFIGATLLSYEVFSCKVQSNELLSLFRATTFDALTSIQFAKPSATSSETRSSLTDRFLESIGQDDREVKPSKPLNSVRTLLTNEHFAQLF